MVIVKAKAGKTGVLEIEADWLGRGQPRIFLEPTGLGTKDLNSAANETMMKAMLGYLFSSFIYRPERWWAVLLDINKTKEAYQTNSKGITFKPVIYKNHLKHNLSIIEDSTLMQLIEKSPNKGSDLLARVKTVASTQTVNEDKEIEEEANLREMLSQIKLKDIDNSLSIALNLPMKDVGELGEEESKKLRERQKKGESTEEDQVIWDRMATNKKLLEALIYNIGLLDKDSPHKRGGWNAKRWEAGPGYSDFETIDVVKQKVKTQPGDYKTESHWRKKDRDFHVKLDKNGDAHYYITVKLDFEKYFKTLFDDGRILYYPVTTPTKVERHDLSIEIAPDVFGIQNAVEWGKSFLTEDGNFNMQFVNGTKTPPQPDELNLTTLLGKNDRISDLIKDNILPHHWSEIFMEIRCEIGYPQKRREEIEDEDGKGTGEFQIVTGDFKATKFIVERMAIKKTVKIKLKQWTFREGSKPEAGEKKLHGKTLEDKRISSPTVIGGEKYHKGSWRGQANVKIASVLHPIRRNYDRLRELIL